MANRIPRNATHMNVEFLTETSAGAAGTKLIAKKTSKDGTEQIRTEKDIFFSQVI